MDGTVGSSARTLEEQTACIVEEARVADASVATRSQADHEDSSTASFGPIGTYYLRMRRRYK